MRLGQFSETYPEYPQPGDLTLETIKRDAWLSEVAEREANHENPREVVMEQAENTLPVHVGGALAVKDVVAQVQHIQSVMQAVMKEGEHFGVIPGTGTKKSLYKSGAEKLSHTFQLAPKYTVERNDMPDGHREYEVVCELSSVTTGHFLGAGVGVCSTMETKYRFRTTNTGREVPREYWNTLDPQVLGGPQYSPKKVEGRWVVMERIVYDNPADYYNTVKKMAKKRAFVDAVLTVTAASDLFTQDLEDLRDNGVIDAEFSEKPQQGQAGKGAPNNAKPQGANGRQEASQNQMNYLATLAKKALGPEMGEEALSALKTIHGNLSKELASKIINNLQRGNSGDLNQALDQAASGDLGPDQGNGGEPESQAYNGPEEPPAEAYNHEW